MAEREKQKGKEGEGEARVEIERRFPWRHGRRLSYTSSGSRTLFSLSQAAIRIFRCDHKRRECDLRVGFRKGTSPRCEKRVGETRLNRIRTVSTERNKKGHQ